MSRAEFIALAADTFHNKTMETSMSKYVGSTLHCQVALDRLDEFTIDQIMKTSIEDDQTDIVTTSIRKRLAQDSSKESKAVSPKTQNLSKQTTTKTITTRTTITTLTTEKTTVKHKSTANSSNQPKRLKTSTDDCICLPGRNSSALTYQRIYLKCFICSKREYIDAQLANSDILHLHWLEHDHDLSLNIYDSEIDSILTRVVEFFNFPKRHALEGKIQTVFILNSEEVRKTRSIPLSDDTCIVID